MAITPFNQVVRPEDYRLTWKKKKKEPKITLHVHVIKQYIKKKAQKLKFNGAYEEKVTSFFLTEWVEVAVCRLNASMLHANFFDSSHVLSLYTQQNAHRYVLFPHETPSIRSLRLQLAPS